MLQSSDKPQKKKRKKISTSKKQQLVNKYSLFVILLSLQAIILLTLHILNIISDSNYLSWMHKRDNFLNSLVIDRI